MYSNPPVHGARLVAEVLGDKALLGEWEKDCLGMAERITSMRTSLRSELEKAGSNKPWSHITDQIGMFCYSGLTPDEVLAVREKHSVYLTNDGRVSMAGVTSSNVEYLAQALHDVTK
jgi:aspartate aminotransferase